MVYPKGVPGSRIKDGKVNNFIMKNSKKSCSPRPGLKIFFRLGEDDRSHCLLLDCTTVTINLIQAEVFFEMKLANSSELE